MTEHDPDSNVFANTPTQSDISAVERMMSEIPEDVLNDAKSVHLSLIGRGIDSSIRVIARAILAERERCALKATNSIRGADEDEQPGDDDWAWRTAGNRRAQSIAKAIRGEG